MSKKLKSCTPYESFKFYLNKNIYVSIFFVNSWDLAQERFILYIKHDFLKRLFKKLKWWEHIQQLFTASIFLLSQRCCVEWSQYCKLYFVDERMFCEYTEAGL